MREEKKKWNAFTISSMYEQIGTNCCGWWSVKEHLNQLMSSRSNEICWFFLRLFPCKLLHFPLERQKKSFFVLFSKMLALNVGVYGEPRGVQYQTFNCFILFTFASAQPHLSMRVILFRSSVHILCFKGTYGEHIFSVVF